MTIDISSLVLRCKKEAANEDSFYVKPEIMTIKDFYNSIINKDE